MTAHDDEQMGALARDVESGVVGGREDGAGLRDRETGTWEVEVSCDHSTFVFEVVVSGFLELVAALTTLAYRHDREVRCACIEDGDAVACAAVDAWRERYGTDPIVPNLGTRA